ncbi:cysteine hydrolase family protein [Sporosarcina pasteurii]|uniref:Isochorismatase family protein yecD n=1 Tax=Sporosarcina pasteurii TaxID=1474 RepID=A0A380BQG6_SPOPA|nr:isochorismatase family cysteine hydrolase [Sporosarcina pasteurii]MDS9471159.1 isochorismatase family cysteine hydrolase [Sporosarcina pasteurii]QBQ05202.1 cysteine hydrolase [Sporosarcina pasteurii]SUJ05347.1 Isochorismatase family protein yecD [Sporosarcina pasteurii]
MKKALLVIDYTVDFVAEEGALSCGEPGRALESYIASLTEQFIDEEQFVVFPVDVHELNDPFHPETEPFPPHNIRGTAGRDLYGSLLQVYEKNKDKVVWMDKTRFSAFAGTDLELQLRARGITELHLVGVCTDICILHTSVDAYNKGFDIFIHEKGVASFNQAGHEWALGHFENTLNAKIIR